MMEPIFAVLRMAWGFFTDITCPFLGISFASLFLGVMIVNFSIRLLKPLLGIGGSLAKDGERRFGRERSRRERERSRQNNLTNKKE